MSTPTERKFYNSPAWRAVREQALCRDEGLCVMCRIEDKLTPAKEVDHIKPVKTHPHLRLSLDNTQCLCRDCHETKTRSDLSGTPRICIHGDFEYRCEACGVTTPE